MRSGIPYEKEFRELLGSRGLSPDKIEEAVTNASDYVTYLQGGGVLHRDSSVDDAKRYVKSLMENGRNTIERVDAICMYANAVGKLNQYLYLAELVGGAPLYQSYLERTFEIAGEEAGERVFGSMKLPPIGSSAEEFPEFTREMLKRMNDELNPEQIVKILSGNHHKIPPQAFEAKKKLYEASSSLDEFLRKDHERVVNLLETHMKEGRLWYRKNVSPEFLDFIGSDQERLSARREGDTLFIKQIPYEFEEYLEENEPKKRRYHFCHCHLARRSILEGEPVPSEFCHCSGGYLKQPYDHIFGEELEVQVLQSVLAGDDECRFAVKLPQNWRQSKT
ncbi:hypothetical protein JXL21_13925 [Candidatus Bathyarchaeota archaeon]|nr:hypothetical protein [Candidatus Bathyarchaeota archaeon]